MDLNIHSLMHVVPMIERINTVQTNEELVEIFARYTQSLGFTHYALGPLQNPEINMQFGISNFPPDIVAKWQDENYLLHDPIVKFALATDTLFTWREAQQYASRFGEKIYQEFSNIEMQDGVGIPIKIASMPKGIISLAKNDPTMSVKEKTNLMLVCVEVYTKYMQLNKIIKTMSQGALTKREIDVLHYVAAGKSNWEAAKILNISEDGVKKHMQNICRKLEATNRVHAVTLAMRAGIILP